VEGARRRENGSQQYFSQSPGLLGFLSIKQLRKVCFHKTSSCLLETRVQLQTIHAAIKRSTALVSAQKKNHSHKSAWLSGCYHDLELILPRTSEYQIFLQINLPLPPPSLPPSLPIRLSELAVRWVHTILVLFHEEAHENHVPQSAPSRLFLEESPYFYLH
jgi:hypothetical protein